MHKRFEGLLATDVSTQQQQDTLANLYQSLNPVRPLAQINNDLVRLWHMAERTIGADPYLRQRLVFGNTFD